MIRRKGSSLPVNSTGILILVVLVLALVFSIVSSGVQEEVARMLSISEENTPSEESIQNFLPFLSVLGYKSSIKFDTIISREEGRGFW